MKKTGFFSTVARKKNLPCYAKMTGDKFSAAVDGVEWLRRSTMPHQILKWRCGVIHISQWMGTISKRRIVRRRGAGGCDRVFGFSCQVNQRFFYPAPFEKISRLALRSSFRGARSASPESITPAGSMDSGPAPRGASRNDERIVLLRD